VSVCVDPTGLLIDSEFEAPADAPLFVSVWVAAPPAALPLVAFVLPVLLSAPPVAAPPFAAPLAAAPPGPPAPPVAVDVVAPVCDCVGLLVLVVVLVLVLVVVAVWLPVDAVPLDWVVVPGPAFPV